VVGSCILGYCTAKSVISVQMFQRNTPPWSSGCFCLEDGDGIQEHFLRLRAKSYGSEHSAFWKYQNPDDADGVSLRKIVWFVSTDLTLSSRRYYWILLPWKLQDTWGQYVSWKCCYPPSRLHSVIITMWLSPALSLKCHANFKCFPCSHFTWMSVYASYWQVLS